MLPEMRPEIRKGRPDDADFIARTILLAQRGFYRSTPDGQFGGETREALRGYQASIGAPANGFASSTMLDRLRRQ